MQLDLRGPRERYQPARLAPPTGYGYVHVVAVVEPPRGRIPLVGDSARREALIARLRPLAEALRSADGVVAVTLYRAVLLPATGATPPWLGAEGGADADRPETPGAFAAVIRGVRFDLALLVTAETVERLPEVMAAPAYRDLIATLSDGAGEVQEVASRCVRRIDDVDQVRPGGIYIFNHFLAADREAALAIWQQLAGWYAAETGLDNSIVLEPVAPAPYAFVNHARWDMSLATLARRQFAKATFRTFVLANLRAHHVVAMPGLYRLA